ncbi:hypothetical protein [Pseudonocardia sp.]|uniref:hypothetical protein n=1 Tax=Pseudonocardia sp. TaxID=60912 RepID=UPI003D105CB5
MGRRRLDRWDAAIVGYALVAALFRPLTLPAAVAVLAAGAVLLVVRARRPVGPHRPVPRAAVVAWAALLAAGALWEAVATAWGNDADHPTLSLLLDPVLDTYPGRLAGYLAWLTTGRWLVNR